MSAAPPPAHIADEITWQPAEQNALPDTEDIEECCPSPGL
jgi:hypothetical protein